MVVGPLIILLGALFLSLRPLLSNPLDRAERLALVRGSSYYRGLSERKRRDFEARLREFIDDKDFIGRGLAVTTEMKVLIGASAVQLTFGLGPLLLMHFTRIIIYPDRYRNRIGSEDHVGEVNPGMRVIAISWKHFLQGYADPGDARNVGLHEMAHALWFEDRIPNAEQGFLDERHLRKWRELAEVEALRIRSGHQHVFRHYAATDQAEFFAVAVEYFFERPKDFARELPELYATLRTLLRQDPLQPSSPSSPA